MHRSTAHLRRATAPSALLAAAALFALCGFVLLPGGEALAEDRERRVVVLIPGVTGVELVEPTTGRVAWGRGGNLMGPRDGGHTIAIPLSGEKRGPDGVGSLVPGRAIESLRLGPITKPVYAPIAKHMEEHGWRRGDLDDPQAADDFFLFGYDWRRDNILAANQLAARLQDLARSRDDDHLQVSLICQSNGAHICRYVAKYGQATLDEAERDESRPLEGVEIEQVILIGNANGGSLRILRFFNEGRKYVTGIGRKFHPETFFTLEALFQDLPVYRDDLFVDELGRPLEVDIYDPESWRRYGWSIYGRETAERLSDSLRPDLFADAERRRKHLADSLALAQRLHDLLQQDVPVGRTRYYLIQNQAITTPDRAVLRKTENGWETLIIGDKRLRELDLEAVVTSPGDGHATAASQQWLSPSEHAAFGAEPYYVDGGHFDMIVATPTLDYLLSVLHEPRGVQPGPESP